ncbi:hypothetical protein CAOG_009389 [Capsaspora owczarzaki ATCC 30864]|uniref:Uncharacterized protein n=1 Tax=Capsaspora owczarzaki (strain ATCC 30864) TaxID=595528 RepID=A0A0D2WIP5_CAPO3|nr:hypothetical protein CAOG_009389 [Capsaspora owczarzaki ATCC 30864]
MPLHFHASGMRKGRIALLSWCIDGTIISIGHALRTIRETVGDTAVTVYCLCPPCKQTARHPDLADTETALAGVPGYYINPYENCWVDVSFSKIGERPFTVNSSPIGQYCHRIDLQLTLRNSLCAASEAQLTCGAQGRVIWRKSPNLSFPVEFQLCAYPLNLKNQRCFVRLLVVQNIVANEGDCGSTLNLVTEEAEVVMGLLFGRQGEDVLFCPAFAIASLLGDLEEDQ